MSYSAFRIATMRLGGELYTPVLSSSGHVLGPAEVEALAVPRATGRRAARFMRFVLADEGAPRSDIPPLCLSSGRWTWASPLFVELGDSGLAVATVETVEPRPAGATPGAQGVHVVATARLTDSELADIVWDAVREGVLSGVCGVVGSYEDESGWSIAGEFIAVRLGNLESNCLGGARVLEAWQVSR